MNRPVSEFEVAKANRLFSEAWELLDGGKARAGFRLLMRAAELGDIESQQGVGYCLDVGLGVRRSERDALYWYRRAARAGDACAACNIGILYKDKGSRRLAMRWFQKSVELGLDDTLLEIARLQLESPRTRAEAILTLRRLLRVEDIVDQVREDATALLSELTRVRLVKSARS